MSPGARPALLLATLALAASCKSRSSQPEPEPPPPERRALTLHKLAPERSFVEFQKPPPLPRLQPVELLESGAAPRRALRHRPDEREREFTITARLTTREFHDGAWSERVALPEVTLGLGLRRKPEGDGQASQLAVRGLPATVAASSAASSAATPAASSAANAARARAGLDEFLARYRQYVERRRARVPLSAGGELGTPTLTADARQSDDAEHIRAELTQLLLESVVRWPEQPVGEGARWRAEALLYRGRAVVTQRAEYQLLSAPGERMRLAVTITQIGEHQTVRAPELPAGHIAELVALFWRAHGEIEVDANVPTPTTGTLTTELRVHGRVIGPGGTDDYSLESLADTTLRTAAGD